MVGYLLLSLGRHRALSVWKLVAWVRIKICLLPAVQPWGSYFPSLCPTSSIHETVTSTTLTAQGSITVVND